MFNWITTGFNYIANNNFSIIWAGITFFHKVRSTEVRWVTKLVIINSSASWKYLLVSYWDLIFVESLVDYFGAMNWPWSYTIYVHKKPHNYRPTACTFTHPIPNAPFLYPWKHCFQWLEKRCIGNKWVKQKNINEIYIQSMHSNS